MDDKAGVRGGLTVVSKQGLGLGWCIAVHHRRTLRLERRTVGRQISTSNCVNLVDFHNTGEQCLRLDQQSLNQKSSPANFKLKLYPLADVTAAY